jgi:tyrosyl-DNA phosphodiesterase-1
MERERLERQKRLRGDVNAPASSSEDEDESQDVEKKDAGDERETKRRRLNTDAGISASTPIAQQRDVPAVSRPVAPATNELFLDGEVRPTWNAYAEGDTRKRFKIQDIIGDVSPIIYI